MSTVLEKPGSASADYVEADAYIDYQIEKTRSGVKSTDMLTASVGVLTLFLGYLLAFVICDHWFVPGGFAPWMRVVMLSAVGGGCIAWFVLRVVLPYLKSVNSLYAARIIEQNNPELRSTLLNLVDLSEAGREVPEAIRNTLQKRAAVALAHTDIDQAVDRRPLMRTMYVLLAIVVVGCTYTLLTPKKISASVLRALLPLSEKTVSTQTEILDIKPGDVEILARAQVEVTVDLKGHVPPRVVLYFSTSDRKFVDAELELRPVDGATKQYRGMIAGENGRGILQDMTYRIEAGDATSRDFRIKVQQPPSARVDSVQYAFPAYMEFAPNSEPGPAIDGWEGTQVTVTATANMPVKSATIYFSETEDASQKGEELRMKIDGGTRLTATWPLAFRSDDKSGEKKSYAKFYRVQVRNENGDTDPQPAFHGITIRPDKRPEVRLIDPSGDLDRPANAIVPLMVAARDDFKLKSVRVRVQKNGDDMPFDGTLLDAPQQTFATAPPFEFQLEKLKARPGDILSYWIEARDNRSTTRHPEGQVSNTPKLSIRITAAVDAADVAKQLQDDKQRQEEKLDEIRQQANEDPAGDPQEPMADPRENRPEERKPDPKDERRPEPKPNDPADPAEKQKPRRDRPNEPEKDPAEQNSDEKKPDGQQNGGGEGKSGQPKPGAQPQKAGGNKKEGDNSQEAKSKEPGKDDKGKTRQAGDSKKPSEAGKTGNEKPSEKKPDNNKPDDKKPGSDKPGNDKNADGADSEQRTAKDGKSESKSDGQRGPQPGQKKLNPDDDADNQEALEKILQRERDKKNAEGDKADKSQSPQKATDKPNSDKPGADQPLAAKPNQETKPNRDGSSPENPKGDAPKPDAPKPDNDKPSGSKPGDPKNEGKPAENKPDNKGPNADKPNADKPGADKPLAAKPNDGDAPDIKKPNGDPLDKKNDKPDQKPGEDGKPDSKKPTGKAPEEGGGDKKPKEGVGGSKDKPMQEAPGGSDNGKPDGKPTPDGNSTDKPKPNEGGGSPSKDENTKPMPMPGDKPLNGTETPAEDSKDARKQKATGDETGKATPNDDPNSDPTKAKNKLDRDPDKQPVKRPGDPKGGDPSKVERRDEKAPDGARKRDPNASSAKSDKESPEGAPDPSGKPSKSGEKADTGKPGEKPSENGKPQDGKPSDGRPQEGKPREGAPSKDQPGQPGNEKSKEGQPQPGKPGEGQSDQGKPGEGQPGNEKPNAKPGEGDPKGQGKSDSKSEGKSSDGKPSEGGKPGSGKPGGDPKDGAPSGQSPDKAGQQPRGNSGDSEIGAGGDGQGSGNSGSGGSGSGSGEGEAANAEDAKKAANLVLKKLQDQLDRGDVDNDLLKELGWTEEEMKRFVSRLDKQINDPAEDQTPAAQARRRQFEETLKSLDLRSSARRRKGSESAKPDADGGIGPRKLAIPAEYREQYEGFTRDLARRRSESRPAAPKK